MLDLFRAIMPVYHQSSLEEIPGLSMLFFNDCMYISHHLLTLGFHYQVRFPIFPHPKWAFNAPKTKTPIPLNFQLGQAASSSEQDCHLC